MAASSSLHTASDDSLPTRASLLGRVRSGDDPAGWEEFYRTYRGLIHGFARKCQLSEEEAQDVVVTTMESMVGALPEFQYDPARCRFKTWLLSVARSRIGDVRRKRARNPARTDRALPESLTAGLDQLPDRESSDQEQLWEEEWQRHLLDTAAERLKKTVQPLHFQVFYLCVLKEQPAAEVAQTVGVNIAHVYLISHRLKKQFGRILEAVRKAEDGI